MLTDVHTFPICHSVNRYPFDARCSGNFVISRKGYGGKGGFGGGRSPETATVEVEVKVKVEVEVEVVVEVVVVVVVIKLIIIIISSSSCSERVVDSCTRSCTSKGIMTTGHRLLL